MLFLNTVQFSSGCSVFISFFFSFMICFGIGLLLALSWRRCRRGALKGAARVPTHKGASSMRRRIGGRRQQAGGSTEEDQDEDEKQQSSGRGEA